MSTCSSDSTPFSLPCAQRKLSKRTVKVTRNQSERILLPPSRPLPRTPRPVFTRSATNLREQNFPTFCSHLDDSRGHWEVYVIWVGRNPVQLFAQLFQDFFAPGHGAVRRHSYQGSHGIGPGTVFLIIPDASDNSDQIRSDQIRHVRVSSQGFQFVNKKIQDRRESKTKRRIRLRTSEVKTNARKPLPIAHDSSQLSRKVQSAMRGSHRLKL